MELHSDYDLSLFSPIVETVLIALPCILINVTDREKQERTVLLIGSDCFSSLQFSLMGHHF